MVKTFTRVRSRISSIMSVKRLALLLIATILVSGSVQATSGVGSYYLTTSTGVPLEDMSTGANLVFGTGMDDYADGMFNIGFTFTLAGTSYTDFSVSTNGVVVLGTMSDGSLSGPFSEGTTTFPTITPLWQDLYTASNGSVSYKLVGTSPNQKLVVDWKVRDCCSGASYDKNFQVWLNENDNTVQFVYGSGVNPSGGTIGLATSLSDYLSVTASAGSAISSSVAENANNTVWPGAGTSYKFSSNSPLPVKLVSFGARQLGPVVSLDWKVAAEQDIAGYEVERSSDGRTFFKIGSVAALNNGTGDYRFIDYSPLSTNAYYRLRISEVNGSYNYSAVATVYNTDKGGHSIRVTPQPATQLVTLTNLNDALIGSPVVITDVAGHTMYSQPLTHTTQLSVTSWATGVYLIRLSNGEVLRFVKQ